MFVRFPCHVMYAYISFLNWNNVRNKIYLSLDLTSKCRHFYALIIFLKNYNISYEGTIVYLTI